MSHENLAMRGNAAGGFLMHPASKFLVRISRADQSSFPSLRKRKVGTRLVY